jgi:hypothetical protein
VVPQPGAGGLFDANSYLGEWPSRRVNAERALSGPEQVEQRLALMEQRGIRRAAISRLEAVLLKDVSIANQELYELVGHAERLLPVYTLNPPFPAWREHLDRCVREYGLGSSRGGIRLHPSYHGYRLDAPELDRLLEVVAPLDVPVVLPIQLEDARLHHPALQVPDLATADVAMLLSRWPAVRWIVAAATYPQVVAIAKLLPDQAQVWFDISRVQGPVDDVRLLCEGVSTRRLLFGTNLPLHVAESAIMELADGHLPPEDDEAIRFGNAHAAFHLEP